MTTPPHPLPPQKHPSFKAGHCAESWGAVWEAKLACGAEAEVVGGGWGVGGGASVPAFRNQGQKTTTEIPGAEVLQAPFPSSSFCVSTSKANRHRNSKFETNEDTWVNVLGESEVFLLLSAVAIFAHRRTDRQMPKPVVLFCLG